MSSFMMHCIQAVDAQTLTVSGKVSAGNVHATTIPSNQTEVPE